MTLVDISRNEVEDPVLARQFEDEISEAAVRIDRGVPVECAILDEGLHAEIQVEVPGWVERVPVMYPARPGDVRKAVERVLRDVGLVTR